MQREKVFSNLIWRFLERCGAQGVTLVVSIVLARLLDPQIYGLVSLVAVFTAVLAVFIDSGLGNALIQKKDADDLDFSSVFYFNMGLCFLLYTIMFIIAPHIASFYNNSQLTLIVRVMSITLIVSGVKNIQQAYVSRHLLFKKFFFATLIGTIGAAVVGIWMAYNGYGVWALVAQNLVNQILDTVVLWITVKWRPKLMFSFSRFKALFSFAWKLLVTSLITTIYEKIRQLIIGKMYSPADLAFYNEAQQIPYAIISNINNSIDSVLLPAISNVQDDLHAVKAMTRRAIITSTYIISPMMIGVAAISRPMISLLLTDKWLPCVFFVRVACFSFILTPMNTANLNAIKAVGRSDIVLKLEIVKKIIGLIILFVTMWFGVKAIAVGLLIASIISQLINAFPNRMLLDYTYCEQLKDVFPNIFISIVMGITVYMVSFFNLNNGVTLCVQILLGIIVYLALSITMKNKSFKYLKDILSTFLYKLTRKAKTK